MNKTINQSFREYTEQRIKDYETFSNILPEYFIFDVLHLRDAYLYENHLINVKLRLEKILNRSISWAENDQIQNRLMRIIRNKLEIQSIIKLEIGNKTPEEITIEDKLKIETLISYYTRLHFCKMIGCELSKEDHDNLIKVFYNSHRAILVGKS
jgi:hypothetical protein